MPPCVPASAATPAALPASSLPILDVTAPATGLNTLPATPKDTALMTAAGMPALRPAACACAIRVGSLSAAVTAALSVMSTPLARIVSTMVCP